MITVTPNNGSNQSGWIIIAFLVMGFLVLAGIVIGNSVLLNPPEKEQNAISTVTFYGLALTATASSLDNSVAATRQAHQATQAVAQATAMPVQQTLQAAMYPTTATAQANAVALQTAQDRRRAESQAATERFIQKMVIYILLAAAATIGAVAAIVAVGLVRQAPAIYEQVVATRRLEAEARRLQANAAKVQAEAQRMAEHRRLAELRDRQRTQAAGHREAPPVVVEEEPYPVTGPAQFPVWTVSSPPSSQRD